jgi:hypothetical protein
MFYTAAFIIHSSLFPSCNSLFVFSLPEIMFYNLQIVLYDIETKFHDSEQRFFQSVVSAFVSRFIYYAFEFRSIKLPFVINECEEIKIMFASIFYSSTQLFFNCT